MLSVGIDAHDRFYVLCILDGGGKVVKEHTIKGGPDDVAAFLGTLATASLRCRFAAGC